MKNRNNKFDDWGAGLSVGIRIYGALLITSLALLPMSFIPEDAGGILIALQLVYCVVVAPYVFCRGLRFCGLAIRVLNQGSVNSATIRKNEDLKREAKESKSREVQH